LIDCHGLYRSDDGGQTWKLMGFSDSGQIGSISINPADVNDVLVGVMGNSGGRMKTAESSVRKTAVRPGQKFST
jgi:hypothetical protein